MKGRDEKGRFEKGYKPFNYEGKGRLKRKYKRFNGKLMHNACVVWLKHNNLKEIPKGFVIHHRNGDSLNDNIENLILMKDSEHKSLHNKRVGEELINNSPQDNRPQSNSSLAERDIKTIAHVGSNPTSEDTLIKFKRDLEKRRMLPAKDKPLKKDWGKDYPDDAQKGCGKLYGEYPNRYYCRGDLNHLCKACSGDEE